PRASRPRPPRSRSSSSREIGSRSRRNETREGRAISAVTTEPLPRLERLSHALRTSRPEASYTNPKRQRGIRGGPPAGASGWYRPRPRQSLTALTVDEYLDSASRIGRPAVEPHDAGVVGREERV